MDKKLMWFFAFLLSMMITLLAVQYFWYGNLNPAALLGVMAGSAIGWILMTNHKKTWLFWIGMIFWVLFVPVGLVGLIRLIVPFLSIELTALSTFALYLLGVMAMLLFYILTARHGTDQIHNLPMVDERYQYHAGLSGFWSFMFLNFLIIAALLQPWIPQGQIGLWIGVLLSGLIFWGGNLLLLERKS